MPKWHGCTGPRPELRALCRALRWFRPPNRGVSVPHWFARTRHRIRTVPAEGPRISQRRTSMAFRHTSILLALLSGAALAVAASAPSRAADELRIGVIAPMTGPFAQVGKDMVDGFNMYVEEASGDFAGRSEE